MIKKCLFKRLILLTNFLFSSFLMAQNNKEHGAFTELPSRIEEVKMSSISVEKIDKKADIKTDKTILLGSGFLTKYDTIHYAVTCNHVVAQIGADELLLVGFNLGQSKMFFKASIVKLVPEQDVAVLLLGDVHYLPPNFDLAYGLKQKWIQKSLFCETNEIIEGTGALMIGYPLGIGSEFEGNRPLSRIGIVAQSVSEKGTFIIDGIASRGNSGSPIFLSQSSKVKFLGMAVASLNERINLYDENKKLVASLPYNSGLTLCLSAGEILKILKSLH